MVVYTGISHTFRPMLWDAWNASDFQTHHHASLLIQQ